LGKEDREFILMKLYVSTEVLLTLLLLAMPAVHVSSTALEIHTYVTPNTPVTSWILTTPYPTIRMPSIPLLSVLTFHVSSTTLESRT
jgi:hypothetical protein